MSINRARPEMGGRKSVAQCRPSTCSQGSNGGVKHAIGLEEDGFVGKGSRKGDLKPWTLIGGDEAWMSLRWHSAPDICLALNNTLDRAWEWWPPGRLTLQPVPRWATLGHSLSSPSSLCVSLFLSLACQYPSTCLMGPSEELTADKLVSLFPPAILLDLASVISHATDKQLRLQHLSNPPSTPSRDSVITKRGAKRGCGLQ